jgi:hypothetical protein
MKANVSYLLMIFLGLIFITPSMSQENNNAKKLKVNKSDTIQQNIKKIQDTTKKVKSIASKAALRSAILPGLGQIYNKKYWKLPLVYGAIAIPVSLFTYNKTWYERTRFAYQVRSNQDTANYGQIWRSLKPISTESLKRYRNEFRKSMDISVLYFLLAWGLNVVDATVDGHLRTFDIGDDLSMQVKPYIPSNLTSGGLTFKVGFKKKEEHPNSIGF